MAAGHDGPLPRLAITPGEPAGIGPEVIVALAQSTLQADLVVFGDACLLQRAARRAGTTIELSIDDGSPLEHRSPGALRLRPVPLPTVEKPGHLDVANAPFVLATLDGAVDGCLHGDFHGMVTAPLHKGIINDAGQAFTGHTEWLARRAGCDVVMLLMSDRLKVAMVTTHMPLAHVPAAITAASIERCLRILHGDLERSFGITQPRIAVLGLNPHAGEGGHLGHEEQQVIAPLLERLRTEGMTLHGPLPADTAFIPAWRERYDAVLAMYHDQALPVLKAEAFDSAINTTLGLPFVRTSVDHGTALEIAGANRANSASMLAATRWAMRLAANRQQA